MPNIKLAVKQFCSIISEHRLTYDEIRLVSKLARAKLEISKPRTKQNVPELVPEIQLNQFFEYLQNQDNTRDVVALKLMFYTGLRNAELCNLEITNIDLMKRQLYVFEGKGKKSRYVPFPEQFGLVLKMYIDGLDNRQRYLFETNRKQKLTTRRLQQLVQEHIIASELDIRLYPHLLRHHMLTHLTREGMSDSQIQLISGHSSKKSLEVYQHLALPDVVEDYQKAMRGVK